MTTNEDTHPTKTEAKIFERIRGFRSLLRCSSAPFG
jgi:hypothetical protein